MHRARVGPPVRRTSCLRSQSESHAVRTQHAPSGGTRPSAPQRRSPRAPHHLRSLIRCHACPLPRVHPRAPASCPTRPTSERPPLFPLAPSRLSTQPFRPLDGGGRVAPKSSHACSDLHLTCNGPRSNGGQRSCHRAVPHGSPLHDQRGLPCILDAKNVPFTSCVLNKVRP